MRLNSSASRRAFLGGLGTAPLAAGPALAVAPLGQDRSADGELLRLGVDLDEALARYLDLCRRKAEAVTRFKASAPEIPLDIVRGRPWHPSQPFQGEPPPDHDGIPCPKLFDYKVMILWPHETMLEIEQLDGRTTRGRLFRRLKPIVERYHAEHLAAREAVGLPMIEEERHYAGRSVIDLGNAILRTEARTLSGLAVKGRAALARQRVRVDESSALYLEEGLHSLLNNLAALDGREPLAIRPKEGESWI